MSHKHYSYLTDNEFLRQFDLERLKEKYIKIIVLTKEEKPITAIEGKVTSGNLNLDGSSSIRRTCSLSLIASEQENNLTDIDNLLSINKKVNIEIGFKNTTKYYTEYDIIWYPLGIYVINNPSLSHSTGGVNISLQLKDKMCLLNGECGGVLPASVTFHEYETLNADGDYIIEYPTIVQIIQELVHHWGGEQSGKIIIEGLDTRIKKVMKWTGSSPVYLKQIIDTQNPNNKITYDITTDSSKASLDPGYKSYEYGEDIGYIYTDFIYPGELIGEAGNSVCDILDKIKTLLGNYEYFYDVYGNFIFREKKNYLNTTKATEDITRLEKSDYIIDLTTGKTIYTFDSSVGVTSFSNAPQYQMIKNDFIVWGMRKDALGNTYPIRYHLAIDKKPQVGNTYKVIIAIDNEDQIEKAICPFVYENINSFPTTGRKGYYYLANDTNNIYIWDINEKIYIQTDVPFVNITTTDWRSELYLAGAYAQPHGLETSLYYTELANEWGKIYDLVKGDFREEVKKHPYDMDYYLDFIDSEAAISELSISNIGKRSKVVVDDKVNCMFEPVIPDLVFINIEEDDEAQNKLKEECDQKGQNWIQVSENIFSKLASGGNFNSAYVMIRDLLYQYTNYNESITVNAIPIYYLEPNYLIAVRDIESGIFGNYMINSISIPFDVNGTMSISCSKALERI